MGGGKMKRIAMLVFLLSSLFLASNGFGQLLGFPNYDGSQDFYGGGLGE